MGMFLSFLGGAATGLTEEIDKSEKEAKAYASMATKALYENYGKTVEANRKLESEMKSDRDFIVANKPDATPDQVQALLSNPEVMKKYKAYANPTDVNLDTLIKITKANPSVAVAAENVEAFPAIQSKAKEVLDTIQKSKGRTGLGGMIDSIAERSGNTAAVQTANALGVSLEELQRTKLKGRPTSDATFDMTVFKEAETYSKAEDKLKLALLNANKSGDAGKVAEAEAGIKQLKVVNDQFTDAQKQFANKSAQIRKDYLFGTAQERAAAKPEYDKLMSDLQAEARAKKVGEDSGESGVPKLSTLNAFAGSAAAKVIAAKYGNLLTNKQLALIEKPDGSTDFRYTGDDAALRKEINLAAYNAAKSALSMYTDSKGNPATRDVASVLNSYAATVQPVVRRDGALPTEPAAPPPSFVTRPTAPAPAQPVKPAPVAAPAPVPAAQPAAKPDVNAARAEANAAIGKGANKAAVAAEFKKQTGQDL